jgi:hypothetical protein
MVYLMTKNGYVGDVFQALLTALSDQNMKNELRHNESLTVKAFSSLLWCAIIFKLDNATKRLYEQGYQREDILNLFKIIENGFLKETRFLDNPKSELTRYTFVNFYWFNVHFYRKYCQVTLNLLESKSCYFLVVIHRWD